LATGFGGGGGGGTCQVIAPKVLPANFVESAGASRRCKRSSEIDGRDCAGARDTCGGRDGDGATVGSPAIFQPFPAMADKTSTKASEPTSA
jgi:hypothetical protein